jgi:hypothetical protein
MMHSYTLHACRNAHVHYLFYGTWIVWQLKMNCIIINIMNIQLLDRKQQIHIQKAFEKQTQLAGKSILRTSTLKTKLKPHTYSA